MSPDTPQPQAGRRWGRRREQRECFHHDRKTGESFIGSRLFDLGRRKEFWCMACGQRWFV